MDHRVAAIWNRGLEPTQALAALGGVQVAEEGRDICFAGAKGGDQSDHLIVLAQVEVTGHKMPRPLIKNCTLSAQLFDHWARQNSKHLIRGDRPNDLAGRACRHTLSNKVAMRLAWAASSSQCPSLSQALNCAPSQRPLDTR